MPVSVRVAAGLLAALAALLLIGAVLTWFGREGAADRFVAVQPELDRAAVLHYVVVGLVRDALVGVLGAAAAWGLTRRRSWARWAGVAMAGFLGLLTVLSAFSAGGTSVFSLLLIVLCVGALSSLLARTTTAWTAARGRG
jgi:hypothetical protein